MSCQWHVRSPDVVSMESGLEDRNNSGCLGQAYWLGQVSMESGLEDRNNKGGKITKRIKKSCLNGVRPRRPEQFRNGGTLHIGKGIVSMESGLEDRNNVATPSGKVVAKQSQWSPA